MTHEAKDPARPKELDSFKAHAERARAKPKALG
jgi:hypothetical protein